MLELLFNVFSFCLGAWLATALFGWLAVMVRRIW